MIDKNGLDLVPEDLHAKRLTCESVRNHHGEKEEGCGAALWTNAATRGATRQRLVVQRGSRASSSTSSVTKFTKSWE